MKEVYQVHIITLSDRAAAKLYEDLSGPAIVNLTNDFFLTINRTVKVSSSIIPDDAVQLEEIIRQKTEEGFDLIFTTGGTGIGPRDITVDVIKPMLHKEIPGIMEHIRTLYGKEKPAALLSRAVAGIIKQTFVFTLPGSPRAVTEYCSEIFKVLEHAFYMLHGIDKHETSHDNKNRK